MFPVIGNIADLANAAWYYAEGDYVSAGLSLVSAAPLVGYAGSVGKAIKGGSGLIGGIKSVNAARKSAKAAANVAKAASPGCRIVSGVISGAAGFAIGAGAGAAVGVAYHLQETGSFEGALDAAINGGIMGGMMGGAMGLYSGLRNPFLCFTAGTQVMLRQDEDGNYVSVDIKDIEKGDYVLARDEDDPTGAIGLHRVAQKFVRTSYFITHLAIRDVETGNVENLETTDEHPFWVLSKGWTTAKDLEPGDLVLNPDGTYATVESNHETFHPEGVTVYNFEVEGAHTYFVADGDGGESFVWVHNASADEYGLPKDVVRRSRIEGIKAERAAPKSPAEAYNRRKHYGNTPTQADRKAVGAGEGQVADHDPPLVKRYYEGDPAVGEKPGFQMTDAERRASAQDRSRMNPQPRSESNQQGRQMSQYSKQQKKEHSL